MKNIFGKKNSKEELEFVMYCLMIMCVSSLLFVFFRNLNLCYDLGKDDTDNLIVKLLPENVTLLAMVVCSVLIYLMLRNVQKGLVFTKLNSDLIMTIGVVLECNGILQMAFNAFCPIQWAETPFRWFICCWVSSSCSLPACSKLAYGCRRSRI